MNVQAVDLELLDLEMSDNRSPDRKPANGQGAHGAGANGRCADRSRAEASRSKLHCGTLLASHPEPGRVRERDLGLFMSCSSLSIKDVGVRLAASVCFSNRAAASQNAQADTMVVSRRHPIAAAGPGQHHSIEVRAGPEGEADGLGDPMVRVLPVDRSLSGRASAVVACRTAQ
jgi:hypothetical protein